MNQNSQNIVWSMIQEPLGLHKLQCYFWISWTIYYKMHMLFFKKVLEILIWSTKHAYFLVGGVVSPLSSLSHTIHKYEMPLVHNMLCNN